MTATLPEWMTTTGPIDFQDVAALRRDPYLRDRAGKFAAHPADRPREAPRPARPLPPTPAPGPEEAPRSTTVKIMRRDVLESVPRPDGKRGTVSVLTRTVDSRGEVAFIRRDPQHPWGGVCHITAIQEGDPEFAALEARYRRGGSR